MVLHVGSTPRSDSYPIETSPRSYVQGRTIKETLIGEIISSFDKEFEAPV